MRVTERSLSVSSPSLSSCAIDSSAISHGPLQGGKKARVNATTPETRQPVGKKTSTSLNYLLHFSLLLSISFPRYFFSPLRPPAALPLQYLRACKPTSDFHLSRFASLTIRDISARALCFTLECRTR